MALTHRQLNRATLDRQLLLRRERLTPVEGVRRIAAVQAQEAASPYVALWNRLADFDPTALDEAFADLTIVKASLMRVTLHAVTAEDYPAFHEAMLPRLRESRLSDRRFAASGLSPSDVDALVPHLLDRVAGPFARDGAEAMLADHLGAPPDQWLWWALRTYGPFVHAPTGQPWSFGRRPEFLPAPRTSDRPPHLDAVRTLIRRYLEAFGPASVADVARFTLHKRSTIRDAMADMTDTLSAVEGPDGAELADVAGGIVPDDDTPAPPRLLAMWDSVLLAHADRRRIIPEEHRSAVIRRNGDVLPTVLVDGYVAGVWRPVADGIEVRPFTPIDDDTWGLLADEAASLRALLADRDPDAYGGYARWWPTLPATEIRVLGD